jgi:S-adenosylmethionine hydrolase
LEVGLGVITLLTDFGLQDHYVGVMHGVILRINPAATVVDLCHNIAPQDIVGAALMLSTAYRYFPERTIHVVVVDPGVGSGRRAIAVRTPQGTFVAPDNGVLSHVLASEQVQEMVWLSNAEYWLAPVSATFHARDVFAPVAAHLSLGVKMQALGPPAEGLVRLDLPEPRVDKDGAIHGQVVHMDRFGNLITNVSQGLLPAGVAFTVAIAGRSIHGLWGAYTLAAEGELLALVGSHGHVEVAVRNGSAAERLGATAGTAVVVTRA